jgi:mevalonate kinase
VVYGAPAIAFPASLRNEVILRERKGDGFEILSSGKKVWADSSGKVQGDRVLANFLQLFWTLVEEQARKPGTKLHADFVNHGAVKGMGNSAAFATALARCLLKYSKRKMKDDELFSLVQETEERVHGGRASGIDARTVIAGKPQIFMKKFAPVRYDFKDEEFELPKGTVLVAVDTYEGKRGSTSEMIALFAKKHKISKRPDDLDASERKMLAREYGAVFNGIVGELSADGNAKKLGRFMDDNQKLLDIVASDGIRKAVREARKAGALGAKLTGAGGEGGAVIALAEKKDAQKIIKAMKKIGFKAFVVL